VSPPSLEEAGLDAREPGESTQLFNRNVFLLGTSLAVGYSGIDPPPSFLFSPSSFLFSPSSFLFSPPSFLFSPPSFLLSLPLRHLEMSTENFEERFVSTYTTDHGNF